MRRRIMLGGLAAWACAVACALGGTPARAADAASTPNVADPGAANAPWASTALALPTPDGAELAARAVAASAAPRQNPFSGHGAAIGLSALVPGLGQMHEGHDTRGWVFLGIDGALWSTLAISEIQSHLRGTAYRELAQVHARVSDAPHPVSFYRDVGIYSGSDIYNIYIRRDARSIYDNRTSHPDSSREAFIDDYVASHGYFGDDTWQWDTYEHFDRYLRTKQGQHNAARRASLALGGLVVNRLFAILDLTRTRRVEGAALDAGRPRTTLAVTTAPDGRMTCGLHARF